MTKTTLEILDCFSTQCYLNTDLKWPSTSRLTTYTVHIFLEIGIQFSETNHCQVSHLWP